jgi:acyl-CoA hydrolase
MWGMNTRYHSSVVLAPNCTLQERNTTGSVFGGQLLRWGLEAATTAATTHARSNCRLVCMRDVPFLGLVPLGALLHVAARVVAVKASLVRA